MQTKTNYKTAKSETLNTRKCFERVARTGGASALPLKAAGEIARHKFATKLSRYAECFYHIEQNEDDVEARSVAYSGVMKTNGIKGMLSAYTSSYIDAHEQLPFNFGGYRFDQLAAYSVGSGKCNVSCFKTFDLDGQEFPILSTFVVATEADGDLSFIKDVAVDDERTGLVDHFDRSIHISSNHVFDGDNVRDADGNVPDSWDYMKRATKMRWYASKNDQLAYLREFRNADSKTGNAIQSSVIYDIIALLSYAHPVFAKFYQHSTQHPEQQVFDKTRLNDCYPQLIATILDDAKRRMGFNPTLIDNSFKSGAKYALVPVATVVNIIIAFFAQSTFTDNAMSFYFRTQASSGRYMVLGEDPSIAVDPIVIKLDKSCSLVSSSVRKIANPTVLYRASTAETRSYSNGRAALIRQCGLGEIGILAPLVDDEFVAVTLEETINVKDCKDCGDYFEYEMVNYKSAYDAKVSEAERQERDLVADERLLAVTNHTATVHGLLVGYFDDVNAQEIATGSAVLAFCYFKTASSTQQTLGRMESHFTASFGAKKYGSENRDNAIIAPGKVFESDSLSFIQGHILSTPHSDDYYREGHVAIPDGLSINGDGRIYRNGFEEEAKDEINSTYYQDSLQICYKDEGSGSSKKRLWGSGAQPWGRQAIGDGEEGDTYVCLSPNTAETYPESHYAKNNPKMGYVAMLKSDVVRMPKPQGVRDLLIDVRYKASSTMKNRNKLAADYQRMQAYLYVSTDPDMKAGMRKGVGIRAAKGVPGNNSDLASVVFDTFAPFEWFHDGNLPTGLLHLGAIDFDIDTSGVWLHATKKIEVPDVVNGVALSDNTYARIILIYNSMSTWCKMASLSDQDVRWGNNLWFTQGWWLQRKSVPDYPYYGNKAATIQISTQQLFVSGFEATYSFKDAKPSFDKFDVDFRRYVDRKLGLIIPPTDVPVCSQKVDLTYEDITESQRAYADRLFKNCLASVICDGAWREMTAYTMSDYDMAQLLYEVQAQKQDPSEALNDDGGAFGLVTQMWMLRRLIRSSKEKRATRVAALLNSVNDALFVRSPNYVSDAIDALSEDTIDFSSQVLNPDALKATEDEEFVNARGILKATLADEGYPDYQEIVDEGESHPRFSALKEKAGTIWADLKRNAFTDFFKREVEEVQIAVDDDYEVDNPDVFLDDPAIDTEEGKVATFKQVFKKALVSDLVNMDTTSKEFRDRYQDKTFSDLVADYNALQERELTRDDVDAKLDEVEALILPEVRDVIACAKQDMAMEWANLVADVNVLNFEDACDAIEDQLDIVNVEDLQASIDMTIDNLASDFTDFGDEAKRTAGDIGNYVADEFDDAKMSIEAKTKATITETANKAKVFYTERITALKEEAEESEVLSKLTSFSISGLIDTVKTYGTNLKSFMSGVFGLGGATKYQTGWQDSSMFTSVSVLSKITGMAAAGLFGAVSIAYTVISKVVGKLGSIVRKWVTSTFKDGLSFHVRSGGIPTAGIQASSLIMSRNAFRRDYRWFADSVFKRVDGSGNCFACAQLGPVIVIIQDYSPDEVMITVNPVLLAKDSDLDSKNDYLLLESMADSVCYSIKFLNKLNRRVFSRLADQGYSYIELEEPDRNLMLSDILNKAQGVSAWSVVLEDVAIGGVAVAAGVALIMSGYGSIAGIALIAGAAVTGMMLAGPAVNMTKYERLTTDATYANGLVTSVDLANIWTDYIPAAYPRAAIQLLSVFSNSRILKTSEANNLEDVGPVSLVHDGSGAVLDVAEIYQPLEIDGVQHDLLGFIPMVVQAGKPSFQVTLVTDTERFFKQSAQILATVAAVGVAAVAAVKQTINKMKAKKEVRLEAEQWALEYPERDAFDSEEDYQKAYKTYVKQMSKRSMKINRLSETTSFNRFGLSGGGDEDGSAIVSTATSVYADSSDLSERTERTEEHVSELAEITSELISCTREIAQATGDLQKDSCEMQSDIDNLKKRLG